MIPQKDPAKPVTVAFGASAVVFKSVPLKQAAAWEWLRFLAEPEQTADWSIASGYMPLRRSAADSQKLRELWQKSPQAEQAFRLASLARTEPNIAAWQDIREVLQNALSAVLAQRATRPRGARGRRPAGEQADPGEEVSTSSWGAPSLRSQAPHSPHLRWTPDVVSATVPPDRPRPDVSSGRAEEDLPARGRERPLRPSE